MEKQFFLVWEVIIIIGVLLKTPRFSLETPRFSLEKPLFSLDTSIFSWETRYFRWRSPDSRLSNKNLGVSKETFMGSPTKLPRGSPMKKVLKWHSNDDDFFPDLLFFNNFFVPCERKTISCFFLLWAGNDE